MGKVTNSITDANSNFNTIVFFIIVIVVVILLFANTLFKQDPCERDNKCEEHTITTKNKWN